jgi:hypothetical protein
MNEQDQRALYTAFVLLGLLVRGAPINSVPDVTKSIVDLVITRADE